MSSTFYYFIVSTVPLLQPIILAMSPHIVTFYCFRDTLQDHEKYSERESELQWPDDRHPRTRNDAFALSEGFIEEMPADIQKHQMNGKIYNYIDK
jgi:hypothetical protein